MNPDTSLSVKLVTKSSLKMFLFLHEIILDYKSDDWQGIYALSKLFSMLVMIESDVIQKMTT